MFELTFLEWLGATGISATTTFLISVIIHIYKKIDSRDKDNFHFAGSYRPPPSTVETAMFSLIERLLWIAGIIITNIVIFLTGLEFLKWTALSTGMSIMIFGGFELIDWWTENH